MDAGREPRVALVAMPWPGLSEPSLGLAVLAAELRRHNVSTRVHHLYVRLLEHLTQETYEVIGSTVGLNEFIFTSTIDDLDSSQLDHLLDVCSDRAGTKPHSRYKTPIDLAEASLRIRNEVIPAYLEDCADRVLTDDPTMVGFTCMFDQTLASAALARVLRRRRPDLLIVAGGYALFGDPGAQVLTTFTEFDAVVQGDGEPSVLALAEASVGRRELSSVPNVRTSSSPAPKAVALAELAEAPVPEFDDWFNDVRDLEQEHSVRVVVSALPVEGSRGCWWGEVSHCTFCGIDDETLRYRTKPAAKVLDELRVLRGRYGDLELRFSDYILAREHYDHLLPVLERESPRFRLSCEIKANQTPERMRQLAAAGFVAIQPGIESFSPGMLTRMAKGVRGIQNVATLKHGYLNRIVVHYNVLFGYPDEDPEWTKAMLAQLPTIYHLSPPISRSLIQVTRFAPLHSEPHRFGIYRRHRHDWRYDVMFSKAYLEETGFDLDRYVYTFERNFDQSAELVEAHNLLVHQVEHWKSQHRVRDVALTYDARPEGAVFADSRFGPAREIRLDESEWRVYQAIDEAPVLESRIPDRTGGLSRDVCRAALDRLEEERLVWREGATVLGLAVPEEVHTSHVESNWKSSWLSLL